MRFFNDFLEFLQDLVRGGVRMRLRSYLDVASSTPLDRRMLRTIPPIPARVAGANPSALHAEGGALQGILRAARDRVADTLVVHADEIIFTSGATESDNLAIVGTIYHWITDGIAPHDIVIFSTELEHAAVAQTIEQFVSMGVQHNLFPIAEGVIDPKGIIVPEQAKAVLITVMMVSNEIGTIQPIAEIAKRVRKLRKARPDLRVVFHTDATQAATHCSLRIPSLGVDLMTLGATKLYCHKGVGVLYKKRSVPLLPLMRGGGQEGGLRPGTPPVALIHECSYALQYAQMRRDASTQRITALQYVFERMVHHAVPQARITAERLPRSPHITQVAIPGIESELLVIELDARGIAVSAKSACKNETDHESPVVEKLYGPHWGAVRFSFGRHTSARDLRRAVRALRAVMHKYAR